MVQQQNCIPIWIEWPRRSCHEDSGNIYWHSIILTKLSVQLSFWNLKTFLCRFSPTPNVLYFNNCPCVVKVLFDKGIYLQMWLILVSWQWMQCLRTQYLDVSISDTTTALTQQYSLWGFHSFTLDFQDSVYICAKVPVSLQKFSLLHCWNGAGVWIGSEKIGRRVCRIEYWCKL